MDFKSYIFSFVFIIVVLFGSAVPLFSSQNEENSKDSLPRLTLEPMVRTSGTGQCADLPQPSQSVFRDLVEENKCYVDKTEYLWKMISTTQPLWSLSRPRRFGKTLLIDTLESFFKGEKKLFEGTDIYQHYLDNNWPEYPVIRLDFSYNIRSDSLENFEYSMLKKLKQVADLDNLEIDDKFFEIAFGDLIEELNKKYNKKVIVLIDEYDSPYTSCRNKDEATKILRILHNFFQTLKGAVEMVRFSMTTGVTRLSDCLSGANSLVDLTMDPEFANILGFTETELNRYFGSFVEKVARSRGNTTTEIMEVMKKWHYGFRFTVKNESLYSPVSVIGYLRNNGYLKSYTDTAGSSRILVDRLKTFPLYAAELLQNDDLNRKTDVPRTEMAVIADREELSGRYNFDDSTYSSLKVFLFHSGYLSIRGFEIEREYYTVFTLGFSNLELKNDFETRLTFSLTGLVRRQRDKVVKSMIQNLGKHEWRPFILRLESFLGRVPYQLNVNQRTNIEALFHITLYLVFSLCADPFLYQTQPLMEVPTNKERADIIITIGSTTFILEPKMENNLENPVYECKVKYLHAHLSNYDYVVCFGMKFNSSGYAHSWGIAKFSKGGKLLEEDGDILLTTQFDSREKENITNQLTDFKMEHPSFTLQSEKLFEFLEQIGPTSIDEGLFARKFTTDIETLCTFLNINNNLFEPNLKSAIKSFVKRNSPKKGPKVLSKT